MGEETVHALRGVSYDIYPGEFVVSIMGASGSGKTTMLNILLYGSAYLVIIF